MMPESAHEEQDTAAAADSIVPERPVPERPPAEPPVPERPAPVIQQDRIQSIDVLRGVAVLGILVMNIQAFGLIPAAYMNPTALGEIEGSDYWVWYLGHLFTDTKFISIFSMLFGAGIVLMTSRAEAKGAVGSGATHYKRMLWLVVFGLLHSYVLWYGDILYSYGMCGMLVYLFRKMRPGPLLIWGFIGVGIATLSLYGMAWSYPEWGAEAHKDIAKDWAPTAEQIAEQHEIYRGSWFEQFPHRAKGVVMMQTFVLFALMIWHFGGMMLIGMALYKWGLFSAERSKGFYAGLVALAGLVGIPAIAYGVHLHEAGGWELERSFFFGPVAQINRLVAPIVSLGWIGLVMLACKTPAFKALTRPFAAVGQMALTNYLMQTIICTTIFYGHGFGQFGHLGRTELLGVVVAVWIAELIWSPLWLARFRFGPFEWLWRSLTYLKWQPLRRDPV